MVAWSADYYSGTSWPAFSPDRRLGCGSVYLHPVLKLLNKNIRLLLFLTILLITNLESFLLLRHKSPFISDSFFYRHMVYQYLGDDYDQARAKVIETLSPIKLDQISSNFFYNESSYRKTLKHFTKRPFYPWLISIIYRFTNQEYLSFLLPQFLALNIILITAF